MNLIMICKLHQWNKTYFNRQSNDLQSLVELCVAQPSRSQVTGRKEPWKRGCVLIRSCLWYQNPSPFDYVHFFFWLNCRNLNLPLFFGPLSWSKFPPTLLDATFGSVLWFYFSFTWLRRTFRTNIPFYYESRSTFIYHTFICIHITYYITTRQGIKQAL